MDTITTIQDLLTCNGSARRATVSLTQSEYRLIAAAPTMHGALIEAAQASQEAFQEALRYVPEGSSVPPWITRLQQAAERAHAALVTADERFKPLNQQPYPTR